MPSDIMELGAKLKAAMGRAWLVGGAVRDNLLGRPHDDFDLATDLHPDRLAEIFPDARIDRELGACELRREEGAVTITSLREESSYDRHRRPARVVFLGAGGDAHLAGEEAQGWVAQDARRRDFTVNAIYADLQRQVLLDPVGGVEDLAARRIRVIGDPRSRLAEDPLRLLRMHRFAATKGFTVEPSTAAVVRELAPLVEQLSGNRVYAELTATFTSARRGEALQALYDDGIIAVLLPEVAAMAGVEQPPEYHPEGDVLTHVCMVLQAIDPVDAVQVWSALLHDVGKPGTFKRAEDRIRFDGHDVLSAKLADRVLRRFHVASAFRELVVDVCRQHIRFAAIPEMRPATWQRWMREPNFAVHLAFHRADCAASHGRLEIFELATERFESLPPLPAAPLVSGQDVLDRGVAAGPDVGSVLREVRDRVADGGVSTRDSALQILDGVVAAFIKD